MTHIPARTPDDNERDARSRFPNGWRIEYGGDLPIPHVHPIMDLCNHAVWPSGKCWCNPAISDVVVHNSLDRREEFENGRKVS